MLRKHALLLIILCGLHVSVSAEPAQSARKFVLENTEIVSLKSKAGRDHDLVVVLPPSYHSNSDKKYPVLYFVDAYWDTPLLASTYGNLVFDNEVPEFIMVGFSYPAGSNYDRERRVDLTFTQGADPAGAAGGAFAFLDFIKQQVAPFVESHYRGSPQNRVLSGNSLGGLFALTAAYASDNFFSGYIAISPAVQWDNNALFKLDEAYAQKNKSLNARIFISYGTSEYSLFRDPIIAFQKRLQSRKYQNLNLQNYAMKDLDHTSVKGDGYVRGLIWVWKPIKPAGPSGLEKIFTGQ